MRHIKVTTYGDVTEYGKWYFDAHIFYMSPKWWFKSRRCVIYLQIRYLIICISLWSVKISRINKLLEPNVVPKVRLHELLFWRFGGEYNG